MYTSYIRLQKVFYTYYCLWAVVDQNGFSPVLSQAAQNGWNNLDISLANCYRTLAYSKKCPPCRIIRQRTICKQRSNSGPTVCCSEYCSDTLQMKGVPVSTISQQFSNVIIPSPTISQQI